MRYSEWMKLSKKEKTEILEEVVEVRERSVLRPVVYGMLHYEHKDYHQMYKNKALSLKVNNLSFDELCKIVEDDIKNTNK